MADPLSVAASVIAVVGAASQIAVTLERLWSLRDAPDVVLAIMNEVTELRTLAHVLENSMQDLQADTPILQDALTVTQRAAERAAKMLEDSDALIQTKLLRSTELTSDGRPKISRRAWLLHQSRLESLRWSLRDVRQNLSVTFSAINSTSLARIRPVMLQVLDISFLNKEHLSTLSEKAAMMDNHYMIIQSKLDQVISSIQDVPRTSESRADLDILKSRRDLSTALRSHSDHPQDEDSVCISTALVSDRCSNFCRCSCHKQVQMRTPRVLRAVLGDLFYKYTGTPLFDRRRCDFPLCQMTKYGTMRFSYLFPRWAVARAICVTGSWRDLTGVGASWTIRMPRLVNWGPIWSAIEHGNQERTFQLFKERKASPFDIHGGDGRSLLHHAIWYKRFNICYQIALAGADWGHRDVDGSSAADVLWPSILTGVGYRDTALLQLKRLLERDYEFDNMGFNSLHMIVVGLSNTPLAEQLMLDYAEINTTDAHGRTALMWAAMRNNPGLIETLLKWKADVLVKDHEGLTALHYAARQGACKCAELLLMAGCEPDIEDFAGRTPLIDFCFHSRAQIDQIPLFHLLVQWSANVHHKSRRRHWTCLHMAAAAGNTDILQGLLNMSVDLNARNKDGNTPIMMALSENHLNAVRILLEHGAKLDFYDKFGRGTLILAACYGSIAIMEALTEVRICGIDVDAPDHDGNTARDYFEKFRIRDFDEENPDTGEDRTALLALLASANQGKAIWDGTHHDEDERMNLLGEVEMIQTASKIRETVSFEGETAPGVRNDDAASLSTESSASDILFHSCTLVEEEEREHVEFFVDASSRINSFEV